MGTTAPAYKLDVAGDINASGSVRANGVALTSDARLKRNVTTTAYGLATVMQLHPVQYEKKASMESTDYNRKEIGFIAQEVRKVLPTLVTEGKDASKTLAVSYTEIIPVLVKAMQEQEAKIELLEAQNAKLTAATAEMAEMKTAMAEMRSEMNRLVLNKVAGKKVAKN
jgi:HSP90 family molecular chaperone